MTYRTIFGTFIGRRPNQEDCVLTGGELLQEPGTGVREAVWPGASLLAAVCDGMGGHAGGEWASRFVCGRLGAEGGVVPGSAGGMREFIAGIQDKAAKDAPEPDCGTTLAGVFIGGRRVLAFGAGDSRVYKFAPWGIASLLRDHSLVRELVERGEITGDEARRHPHRNIITLGLGPAFREAWGAGDREPEIVEESLGEGECLLLCSDGVHDLLGEEGLLDILGPGPMEHAGELGERLRADAVDNASFVLVSAG